jgi:exosortase B
VIGLYLPTYHSLDQHIWGIVGQGHGPVMLALSLWLAWERWPRLKALPARPADLPGSVLLVLGGLAYAMGRSQDLLFLDAGSQLFLLSGLVLLLWGWAGLRTMWFPIFFLFFVIPIPGSIVDAITAPLKAGVSYVAEHLMYWMGYPIGRSGVTLIVGPYRLLVADACAGINSVFALEAVGVFYLSVMGHTHKWRNILLALCILPISFVSNVLRVVVLVLVTYHFGDEAGQGFVHSFAGILLFVVATLMTIGVDALLGLALRLAPATPVRSAEVPA